MGGDKLSIADFSVFPLLFTLTLPTVKKIGFVLPENLTTYINNVKAELGDVFIEATKVHEGWIRSNEHMVVPVEFEH